MTPTDLALLLFTACNGARVVAYVPQIARVIRDRQGALAVSCMTWSMFALANLSTVLYGALVVKDLSIVLIFGLNTVACLLVVVLTLYKRRRCKLAEACLAPPDLPIESARPRARPERATGELATRSPRLVVLSGRRNPDGANAQSGT